MPALHAGARVRVHGLQKKPEFNNCLGTVKGAADGGRFCVLLDGEAGRELALKPENFSLEAVAAAAEEGPEFEAFEAPARTAVSAQALFDGDVDVPSISR
jgi:hypothetical protein